MATAVAFELTRARAKRRIPPRVSRVRNANIQPLRRIPRSSSQGLRYIVVLRYPCDFVILHIPQHFHIHFFQSICNHPFY